MERFVADERTGLKYELVGDYYLIAGDDEPETPSPWITPLQTMWVMKGHGLTIYQNTRCVCRGRWESRGKRVARCAASSSINPRTGGTDNLQSHHGRPFRACFGGIPEHLSKSLRVPQR